MMTRKERLEQGYESARHAIERMSDVLAHLEEFDEAMEGSAITDELNHLVDKAMKSMLWNLNKSFRDNFGEIGKEIIRNYNV